MRMEIWILVLQYRATPVHGNAKTDHIQQRESDKIATSVSHRLGQGTQKTKEGSRGRGSSGDAPWREQDQAALCKVLVVNPASVPAEHLEHERVLLDGKRDDDVVPTDRLERAEVDVDPLGRVGRRRRRSTSSEGQDGG